MAGLRVHFGTAAEKAENDVGPSRLGMIFGRSAGKKMTATPEKLGEDLFTAIREGDVDAVRELIREGARPDSRDAEGVTALMYAARENYEKMVDVLLEEGADPLLKSDKGLTALMYAASGGNLEVAKLIVQNYADRGVTDESSPDAAELAREKGHYALAALIEQKRQAHLFNRIAKQRKKAQEKKEAEKRHDIESPVTEGLFSAIAGITLLAGLSKVATRFQSFFAGGEAVAAAAESVAATQESTTPAVAPAPPAAPAPAPKMGTDA